MLIEKKKCIYGCENAVITESTKEIQTSNDNLLLEGKQSKKIVKVYTCSCCGRSVTEEVNNSGNLLYS